MIDIEIEDPAWTAAVDGVAVIVNATARAALRAALPAVRAGEADVVVLLADDAMLAGLNERFRDKAGPTNVLSFPAPQSARPHLGDVAIAYGVCAREAREQGKPLKHHLMHLVAHGVLHLVGYDHQTESEAQEMEALERRVLQALGAHDPFQPLAPDGSSHAG
jgi:probable rRNA maturation factor